MARKEQINIAELLRKCPKGMELDCIMFANPVTLEEVSREYRYPITIKTIKGDTITLTEYGQYSYAEDAKCVIFPKGKTTWEGFVLPCKNFKDGDIISNGNFIAIFYKIGTPAYCTSPNIMYYHCYYSQKYCKFKEKLDFGIGYSTDFEYATEEEKTKLFDAIKANGYKWNAETKILEKVTKPKFKVGDKVKGKIYPLNYIITITGFDGEYYTYLTLNGQYSSFHIKGQNNYELVPDKFDIKTLKHFDKVLVRDSDTCDWCLFFLFSLQR